MTIAIDDNHYLLPFDKEEECLDKYLEMINANIMDGYLSANNLLQGEFNIKATDYLEG